MGLAGWVFQEQLIKFRTCGLYFLVYPNQLWCEAASKRDLETWVRVYDFDYD